MKEFPSFGDSPTRYLDFATFAFVSVGTGVGMGLVVDGQLHRGAHGAAGEIGFMPFATALTLPVPLAYQVLAAAPLALTAAILTTGHATGTLAALYTLTVTGHHLTRATQLALTDKDRPPHLRGG